MYEESWDDLAENSDELRYVQVYNKRDTPPNETAPHPDATKGAEITVTSQHGAILAHIAPQPPMTDPQNEHAGDENVQALMSQVASLYTQRQTYFPVADTFVVCAFYEGEVALPDQKRIIEGNISQMGLLQLSSLLYDVPTNRANPGQGSTLIDAKEHVGQKPAVYVEDKLVSGGEVIQPQAPASSSEWVLDPTYQRYRRLVDGKWEWAQ